MALHRELFDPRAVDEWVLPEVQQALQKWRESGDLAHVDLEALPDTRVEAPGVVSFAFLTKEFCSRLLAEARHYAEESGLPQLAPNTMNRDGVILSDIGLRPCFTMLLRRYLEALGARLFGDDSVRAATLHGEPLGTENWGGAALSDHYTFLVRYEPKGDRGLDMHVDDSEVTFNIGLSDGGDFSGGDLVFCGMFGNPRYRRKHCTYRHEVGRCVVHSGKRRHSVLEVEAGQRASLIIWASSITFRSSPEYEEKCGNLVTGQKPWPVEDGAPDAVCLSLTHDRDYLSWAHLL